MTRSLACASSVFLLVTACGGGGGGGGGGKTGGSAWHALVGTGGTFTQSRDGRTWASSAIARVDLLGVACLTQELGWAVGAGGAVARTDDGGSSWKWRSSGLTVDLRAVRFAGDLGVAAGDGGAITVSRDGGDTWSPVVTADSARPSLRGLAASSDGSLIVAVGDGGTLLRSTDRGATFTAGTIADAADLRAVAVTHDGSLMLIVGASSDGKGTIWASRDGARSYTREATPSGALDGVSLDPLGHTALAAGVHGTLLLRATDGSWRSLVAPVDADLHAALVSDDASTLYAAGDRGTLLESTDGGSFHRIALDTQSSFRGLEDL